VSEPAPERAAATAAAAQRPRSCGQLFWVFTRLALQGFGGVLPVAQRELVERMGWLQRAEFLEMLALAQVLPGPNVVNLSLMTGQRFFGWRGAVAAMGGMLLVPLLLVMALTVLASQLGQHPMVAGALRGMGIASAGLVAGTAMKLAGALRKSPLSLPAVGLLIAATVAAIAWWRAPLAGTVLALGMLAWAWAWRCVGTLAEVSPR
jgi:chromate transporter